jgi:hypothetical protein
MVKKDSYEFVSPIPPTRENAASVQRLTLRDVENSGFDNPTRLADPTNVANVSEQLRRLSDQPEQYSGYRHESGLLVAYVKSGEWRVGDELPFVESTFARRALQVAGKLRGNSLNPREHGIFGLVVDESLDEANHEAITRRLLEWSIGQAAVKSAVVVNIVLNERDPVTRVAQDVGFIPQGPFAEAAGAPGLLQQRYRRAIE